MSETGVNLKGITTAKVTSPGTFALLEIFPVGLLTRSPTTAVERNISWLIHSFKLGHFLGLCDTFQIRIIDVFYFKTITVNFALAPALGHTEHSDR